MSNIEPVERAPTDDENIVRTIRAEVKLDV
jgi:hypothetical protein